MVTKKETTSSNYIAINKKCYTAGKVDGKPCSAVHGHIWLLVGIYFSVSATRRTRSIYGRFYGLGVKENSSLGDFKKTCHGYTRFRHSHQ